jgi:hypothetical protein
MGVLFDQAVGGEIRGLARLKQWLRQPQPKKYLTNVVARAYISERFDM